MVIFLLTSAILIVIILPKGNNYMKTIGEIVKENRKRMKLTQLQLATYANVSPKFIIELENNKKTVQLDKILDVLAVFDLTLTVESKKVLEL